MAIDYTTNLGKLRLLLKDVDEDHPLFSNDELNAFLDINNDDIFMAAADACRALATNAARGAILYRLLGQNIDIDKRKIPEWLYKLASKFEARAGMNATAQFVNWHLHIDRDGHDDTDYDDSEDDDEAYYHDLHYLNGGEVE